MSRRHYFGRAATRVAAKEAAPVIVPARTLIEVPPPAAVDAQVPAPIERAVLFGPEVARMLGISLATFHQRRKSGTFPIPECAPRLDRKPRFPRALVEAYARGEFVVMPGRRRA